MLAFSGKASLPDANDELIALFFKFSASQGLPKMNVNIAAAGPLPTPGTDLVKGDVVSTSGWLTEDDGYSIVCKLIEQIRLPACVNKNSAIKLQQGIIYNLSRYLAFVGSEENNARKHWMADAYVTEHDHIMKLVATRGADEDSEEFIRFYKMRSLLDKWKSALKIEKKISNETMQFVLPNIKEKPEPLMNVFKKWKRQLGNTAKESGFFTNGEDYCARKMYIKWSTLFYSAKIVHG